MHSYKILISYMVRRYRNITEDHWLELPYRFIDYPSAYATANDILNGIEFRVESSNDRPNWSTPPDATADRNELIRAGVWDVFGIKPNRLHPNYDLMPGTKPFKSMKDDVFRKMDNLRVANSRGSAGQRVPNHNVKFHVVPQQGQRAQRGQRGQRAQRGNQPKSFQELLLEQKQAHQATKKELRNSRQTVNTLAKKLNGSDNTIQLSQLAPTNLSQTPHTPYQRKNQQQDARQKDIGEQLVSAKNPRQVRRLLKSGADPNYLGDNGMTPLIHALKQKKLDVAKALLVSRGVYVNRPSRDGETPFDVANTLLQPNSEEIKNLIQQKIHEENTNNNNLFTAIEGDDLDAVRMLASKTDVDRAKGLGEDKGMTPLQAASSLGKLEMVKVLIANNADVNKARDPDGATPLWFASHNGHLNVVKELLDEGADVDKFNPESGVTPLYVAVQNGHTNVVNALIEAGADTTMVGVSSNTALNIANGNQLQPQYQPQYQLKYQPQPQYLPATAIPTATATAIPTAIPTAMEIPTATAKQQQKQKQKQQKKQQQKQPQPKPKPK